jgi:probable HAF family extracellular repeat protein
MANDINSKGQLVGVSCDVNFNCRAFLLQSGMRTDLNTLIPRNSPLFLTFGAGINDRGEIAGSACVLSNGACTSKVPAFLAVPCDDAHSGLESCAGIAVGAPAAAQANGQRTSVLLPESVRQHLQRRCGVGRFGLGRSRTNERVNV